MADIRDLNAPYPRWTDGVPWCEERCPHHDGKRCGLIGFRPGAICEPAVKELSALVDSLRRELALRPDPGKEGP